jgi:tRNA threonylcarbamoyl adenosine modification protein YjeE
MLDRLTTDRPGAERHEFTPADLAATDRLAADLAALLKPGDVVALSGDLGAGKSALARMILRHLSGDPALEVPSPTFTLMQIYETPRGAVVHADFYRIGHPDELVALGFSEEIDGRIALVEWPERGAEHIPSTTRLDIVIEPMPEAGEEARRLIIAGGPHFAGRLRQTLGARKLIDSAGWSAARRDFMLGDASTRAYERLTKPGGETAVLMISPPRPDGPPVRGGKPYSAIAKLAERIDAFVAMDKGLVALGYSAPLIHATDLHAGLLLIEDLGSQGVIDAQGPIPERYIAAIELLADLHGHTLPAILPVSEGRDHVVPDYDTAALEIELDLLLEWYAPHVAGAALAAVTRKQFSRLWGPLIWEVTHAKPTWVLRDYHSPNLIWLPAREGLKRVGIIDFQDAVLGHAAYDVASLAQDARVDVPPELEMRLLAAYAAARRAKEPDFDMAAFARAYAILGAQRATKILGIFARLDKRDGKPAYLKHLPRVSRYLMRNLAHPDLAPLKRWYDGHLPGIGRDAAKAD